jgi:uncharacterized protein (DUF58 family)
LLAVAGLVLAGLMVPLGNLAAVPVLFVAAAASVDWALSLSRVPSVAIEGVKQIFTGETRTARLDLDRSPPAGLLVRFAWPEGLQGPAEIEWPDDSQNEPLELTGRARGVWTMAEIFMAWRSRFGLIEFTPRPKLDLDVAVLPDVRPASTGQIDLQVHASLHGQKENAAEGEGSEFHQLRDHQPGESLRRVDWKRSARQRRLLAKETRAERNHNVIAVIDSGYLMRESIAGMAKLDHAINASLALAWAAAVGGDRVGLFTYDSAPRLWSPPEPGRQAFPKMRRTLAELAYDERESNPTLALATLGDRVRRRSLIVVFSDFIDTTTSELMVEQLALLSRRHLVIFVALRDPETDDAALRSARSLDEAGNTIAAFDLRRDRQLVLDQLARLGVMVLDTAPAALTARLVSTYLDLKAREAA